MRLSEYLRNGEFMAAYGEFFNSPAGRALLEAMGHLTKPVAPNFPITDGEAEFRLGYSCGGDFILGLIGNLRELQSKLGSANNTSDPNYGVTKILKEQYGYDDAGRAGK